MILCSLLVLTFWGNRKAKAKQGELPLVAVTEIREANLANVMSITGEMRPYQQINLHAKVAGFLQSIHVDIGDHVKEGSVIACLEIPELHEELARAKAGVAAAQESVKSEEAKYHDVHLLLQRLQKVAQKNPHLIAQQDLDTANSRDSSAAAHLALAAQQVAESKADEDKIETMLDYATITAPFAGVITKRYADPGALIQAGISSNTQAMPVVSLAQDNILRATFPVPESIVTRLHVGDQVQIEIPALNKKILAKVSRMACQVDQSTRTMEAQMDVDNADLSITPGMYAIADVQIDHREGILAAPVQAVKMGTENCVFIVNEKQKVEKRIVELGIQTAEWVEIKQGVKLGDLIIIGNTSELHPGMRVTAKVRDEATLASNTLKTMDKGTFH